MRPTRHESVEADGREMAGFALLAELLDNVRTIRRALTTEG